MSQPEDAAAQALRLAAHALHHISLQTSSSSSSSDEERNMAASVPYAATAPPAPALGAEADAQSPLASPKLAHKLLSSVAQARVFALNALWDYFY
jgi:hypothetical protein